MTDPSNWADATKHSALALAIAHAEGFGTAGAVPTRAHNPGDLKIPGWTGPVTGTEGISVFENDATGWAALEHELALIKAGKSHVYTLGMTIAEMAHHWTDTQTDNWATNVCDALTAAGRPATLTTLLRDVL